MGRKKCGNCNKKHIQLFNSLACYGVYYEQLTGEIKPRLKYLRLLKRAIS
jgi:hypothetical protein